MRARPRAPRFSAASQQAGSVCTYAPNLADVYRRLRPEFVRDWIANPKMILPYTSMPVNIPYQEPPPIHPHGRVNC